MGFVVPSLVSEQSSIVNNVHVDDSTTELVITASNVVQRTFLRISSFFVTIHNGSFGKVMFS